MAKTGAQARGTILQLKITLADVEPAVWRRIEVPTGITFAGLHPILQVTMGWQNSHLHDFRVGDTVYGIPDRHFGGGPEVKDERRTRLDTAVGTIGTDFEYEYDFGDGWIHEILVEDVRPAEQGIRYPRALDGARACPPEDVGGPGGYADFLASIADPNHEEHEEMLEWVDGVFDPELFDVTVLDQVLGAYFGGEPSTRPR